MLKKMFNFKKIKIEKGYYSDKEKEIEVYNIPKITIFGVVGLFILITIFSAFTTIKSGEVGLKVRFGKIVDSSLNEGINFKIPYIEKIKKVNIKVQKVELDTESSSKDLQTITTKLAVNYKVKKESAVSLYKQVGSGYKDTVLIPAIQESIKAVMSKYTAEQTITMRNQVSDECLEEIQNKVNKYGIVIEDFNIIDLDFSEAYSTAIEEKQVAEQKVLTAQQELEKSKIEAEKKVVEAQATKEANELLKQTLTDELIVKQFIEKWDGKLPTTYAGEDILGIFNLK